MFIARVMEFREELWSPVIIFLRIHGQISPHYLKYVFWFRYPYEILLIRELKSLKKKRVELYVGITISHPVSSDIIQYYSYTRKIGFF